MVRYTLLRKATHHERLLTQRVKTPFALSSPRSWRIEGLAVRQPRFLGSMICNIAPKTSVVIPA